MKSIMQLRVIKIGALWYLQGHNRRNGQWFRISDYNTQEQAEKAGEQYQRHAARPDPWTKQANAVRLTVHDSEDAFERAQLAAMEQAHGNGGW